MFLNAWQEAIAYFKEKPYWARVQPLFSFATLYLTVVASAYEYIQWRYHLDLDLALFLRSYLFRQISLGFGALALLALLFRPRPAAQEQRPSFARRLGKAWSTIGAWRLAAAGLILLAALALFVELTPSRVSHIRVRFLTEPSFDREAFVYLLYELNRAQKSWYFEVDFDTFDPSELTSAERARCDGDSLCYAEILARGEPFLGVTGEGLGADSFWKNRGTTSVISTADWDASASPGVYEYLSYATLVQSILIHLNATCHGLPGGAFRESRAARGDLFQFAPRRSAMKAEIMAAHLSPEGEALLLNCFGVDYLKTCSELLRLDWLRSGKVKENLERAYKISLGPTPGPAAPPRGGHSG